jgi:hypothetical protein
MMITCNYNYTNIIRCGKNNIAMLTPSEMKDHTHRLVREGSFIERIYNYIKVIVFIPGKLTPHSS